MPEIPFSRAAYAEAVGQFAADKQRCVRVPTYDAYATGWREAELPDRPYLLHAWDVLPVGTLGLPVQVITAEEDKNTIIPTIFSEDYDSDVSELFLHGVTDEALASVGLRREPQGLPLVLVAKEAVLPRYRRYQKLVTNIDIEAGATIRAVDWVDERLPAFLSYWRQRNIPPMLTQYSGKLIFEASQGNGFNDFIVLRIRQQDDVAVGIFRCFEDQWYWDVTVHDGASHIGNNMLLTALDLMPMPFLNLGVGYYPWKYTWTDIIRYQPGIRYL